MAGRGMGRRPPRRHAAPLIRPCSKADDPAVLAIEEECFERVEERVIADRLADCRRSSSERSPGPLSVPTFVDLALDEGKIVGYCAWTCEPFGETCEQCIHVMNLAVGVDFRRKGIASALLDEALEKFPCAVSMRLLVRADNLGAQSMYVLQGFEEVQRLSGYYGAVDGLELLRSI
ncbi:unnamed protein product [Effrenium voratum]|nr:unnamed protein product [Effrenium voratum]